MRNLKRAQIPYSLEELRAEGILENNWKIRSRAEWRDSCFRKGIQKERELKRKKGKLNGIQVELNRLSWEDRYGSRDSYSANKESLKINVEKSKALLVVSQERERVNIKKVREIV